MNKVISKDGTPIAFDQMGSGDPLILVDGALCSRSMGPMAKLAPLLAGRFKVIAYDRRGRNDSGDSKPYAVEREIEDIAALIRHAGAPAYVFGASSGAALALKAAASGLPIRKLALYEPPYIEQGGAKLSSAGYREEVSGLIAQDRRDEAVSAADAIPTARRHVLKGQNHNVSVKVLAPVLQEFFAT